MSTETLLLSILAIICAIGFAFFQYFFRERQRTNRTIWYALLRFFSVFTLLLLLINPKYKRASYEIKKPSLVLAVDKSASISHLGAEGEVGRLVDRFRESEQLNNRFAIQILGFGSEVAPLDSMAFTATYTDISKVIKQANEFNKGDIAPIVLLSDGNQTLGTQARYTAQRSSQDIYPIVVGDTTVYDDIRVGEINVNKYAYINNTFPVEVFVHFKGSDNIQSRLRIRKGNQTVFQKAVAFDQGSTSQIIQAQLPADKVGVQQYTISIDKLDSEKNTENNVKRFAIEIIDQKTNVLLVAGIRHPDLGALKKSIERNALRSATILEPTEALGNLNDYQLIVLYQPNTAFKPLLDELDALDKNSVIITGKATDWDFLNQANLGFTRALTGQYQEVQPAANLNFTTFILEDGGFDTYPPVLGEFGDITIDQPHDVALYQKVTGYSTENPLLFTMEIGTRKSVVLLGEGLWRWRAQSYVNDKNFEVFDRFLSKLVQYAASNKRKNRLDVDAASFYYGNGDVTVYAQYFDKSYTFDGRASLSITLQNTESKNKTSYPFLVSGNNYKVDLSALDAGTYQYTVSVASQNISRSGVLTIVPFAVEQQFLNANAQLMEDIAEASGTSLYTSSDFDKIKNQLLNKTAYTPQEVRRENIVPLIDWKWLLGVLVALLAIEWFSRKYHGLL